MKKFSPQTLVFYGSLGGKLLIVREFIFNIFSSAFNSSMIVNLLCKKCLTFSGLLGNKVIIKIGTDTFVPTFDPKKNSPQILVF